MSTSRSATGGTLSPPAAPTASPSLRYPLALALLFRPGGAARPARGTTGATVTTVSITATEPWRLSDGPRERGWGIASAEMAPGTERAPPGVALCARRNGGGGAGKTAGVRRGGASKECVVWCDDDDNDGGSRWPGSESVLVDNEEGGVDCEPRPSLGMGRDGGGNWKLTGEAILRTRRTVEEEDPEAADDAIDATEPLRTLGNGDGSWEDSGDDEASPVAEPPSWTGP